MEHLKQYLTKKYALIGAAVLGVVIIVVFVVYIMKKEKCGSEDFYNLKDEYAKNDKELGSFFKKNPAEIIVLYNNARIELGKKIGFVQSDTDFKTENSATTSKQLVADATSVSEQFKNMMDEAASGFGEVYYGENECCMLKSVESLDIKISKYMREFNLTKEEAVAIIPDAIRGTIIVQTPEGLGDAARSFAQSVRARGETIKIDNTFASERIGGYLAIHAILKIETKDGRFLRCEVQFHLIPIHDARMKSLNKLSHKLYEIIKTVEVTARKLKAMRQLLFTVNTYILIKNLTQQVQHNAMRNYGGVA